MAGVEFLGTDGVDDAEVELEPAATGVVGRVLGSLAAALLAVGIVAWAVTDHTPRHAHALPSTSVPPTAAPSVVDIPGRWLVPGLRPSDPVATDPQLGESYALSRGHDLYSIGPTGGLLSYRVADTAHGRLVVDTVHHVIWVLPGDGEPAAVEAYAATTLRTVAATYVHAPVAAGGVLDGRLYVTLRTSPAQLVPISVLTSALDASSTVPAGVDTSSLAVDADRHRLVFLGTAPGGRVRVWFWAAAGGWAPGRTIAVSGASIVALRDTLWLAGTTDVGGARNPVLLRLEPSEISPDLGRGPSTRYAIAAGRFSLLARDTTDGSAWCIDPETGEVQQRWTRTAALVSTSQSVLTSAAGRLVPLDAGDCLG